jgi:hypothetical protein
MQDTAVVPNPKPIASETDDLGDFGTRLLSGPD